MVISWSTRAWGRRSLFLQDYSVLRSVIAQLLHTVYGIYRCYCLVQFTVKSPNYLNWQRTLVTFACVEWPAPPVYLFPRTTYMINLFLALCSESKKMKIKMAAHRWSVCSRKNQHLISAIRWRNMGDRWLSSLQTQTHSAYLQSSTSTSPCMIQRLLSLFFYMVAV